MVMRLGGDDGLSSADDELAEALLRVDRVEREGDVLVLDGDVFDWFGGLPGLLAGDLERERRRAGDLFLLGTRNAASLWKTKQQSQN